jgi:hypothetical protein
MKSRVMALLLASILALTASPVALSQTNNSGQSATNLNAQDWQDLSSLKPGKKILVELKSGNTVDGKLISLTGSKLILADSSDSYSLDQRDILRVYRFKGRWSRGRTAGIGAGIGMVVGTFIGAGRMDRLERDTSRTPSDADEIPLAAGFVIGTAVGAGVGALFGGKGKGELLYAAK